MAIPPSPPPPYYFLKEKDSREFIEIHQKLKQVESSPKRYFRVIGKTKLAITIKKVNATSLREVQRYTGRYRTILTPYHIKDHDVRFLFKLLDKVNDYQDQRFSKPDSNAARLRESQSESSDSDSERSDDSDSSLDVIESCTDEEKEYSASPPVIRRTASVNGKMMDDSELFLDDELLEEDAGEFFHSTQAPWHMNGYSSKNNTNAFSTATTIIDGNEPTIDDDEVDSVDMNKLLTRLQDLSLNFLQKCAL